MAFETKEDLQRVCEAVIGYQKGLEEIDRYIARLNQYMETLNKEVAEEKAAETFREYGDRLEEMRDETVRLKELFQAVRDGENGLTEQFKILGRFKNAVTNFEDAMSEFNQRVDSLTQKLYNKDFNNAIKTMNAIAEETRQSAIYEYRHITDHDYDILDHEYGLLLKDSAEKERIVALLQTVGEGLCSVPLKRGELESLQRLVGKLLHSSSDAVEKFMDSLVSQTPKSEEQKEAWALPRRRE